MILFKKVRFRNFLSFGNTFTEVNLTSHKNTIIVGHNGHGKSVFIDAICYGLFKKPFRNITIPSLANSINSNDMLVEIEFSIGKREYLVKRGIKPNVFEIYQGGVLLNAPASVYDYQDILEKNILKLNYKSFTQIVILGSASFTPFMQLPAATRREIIEDLLDIKIFSIMNNILKDKIQINRDEINKIDSDIRLINEKTKLETSYINEIETRNQVKFKDNQQKIDYWDGQLLSDKEFLGRLNKEIEDKSVLVVDLAKLMNKGTEQKNLVTTLKKRKEQLLKVVTFYNDNDSCPTCSQSIDLSFKTNIVDEKKKKADEVDRAIDKLVESTEKIWDQISDMNDIVDQISKLKASVAGIEKNILLSESKIDFLKKENQTTVGDANPHKKALKKLEKEQAVFDKQMITFKEDREIFDISQDLLKDKGIKSKIIKQYIPVINKLVNTYLTQMEFFVNFELDENFKETMKSRFRDEFSYSNFSEGEKARIDIALLLTWRSIAKMKNSVNTNLLIMDEVFDGSLDVNGIDDTMKILNDLSDNTNLFIISHRSSETQIDKFDRVINIEKIKNFSTIKDL